MKSSTEHGLTRRHFLTGAALAGAGAAIGLAGCTSSSESAPETPDDDTLAETGTADTAPEAAAEPWKVAPEPITDDQISETIDCDIVIVGAGISGLPASMLAAEQGVNVHVVEKAGSYGNARLCTSGFNANLHTEHDIHYDRAQFIADAWSISNGVQGRMSSYGKWFDNSGPDINWLQGIMQS